MGSSKPAAAALGTRLDVMVLGLPRGATVIDGATWDAENARPRQDIATAAE